MIKYAILGYGTVGSGVAEVMAEQREKIASVVGDEVELKYILVRRDYPGDPWADRMVKDFSVIEADPEVSIGPMITQSVRFSRARASSPAIRSSSQSTARSWGRSPGKRASTTSSRAASAAGSPCCGR